MSVLVLCSVSRFHVRGPVCDVLGLGPMRFAVAMGRCAVARVVSAARLLCAAGVLWLVALDGRAFAEGTGVGLQSALSTEPVPLWQRGMSAVGLLAMVGIAWVLSSKRSIFPRRVIVWGLGLQLLFGAFVLKTSAGAAVFRVLNDVVVKLLGFTAAGTEFLFGEFVSGHFTFALNVLPILIFFSSLMAVLYHLGAMQWVIRGLARAMQRTMGTSGAETLSAAANVFVGQTEAPLVIRPFLDRMTRSELMVVMVGGFATVAGTVLAAYVGMLDPLFPGIAGHLLSASVMSAPAALVVAKVMEPETQTPATLGSLPESDQARDANVLDAAARGASEGLQLALNVAGMLLAFLALVALLNYLIGLPFEAVNAMAGRTLMAPMTLEQILGWAFWPVAFLMGVDPSECAQVGALLGEKLVLNEFVAYVHLKEMLESGVQLSSRSVLIVTYALCGFANFGSIAIQLGGIGQLAPTRRGDLARLALRAMFGGVLAACMTACVAGIFA